jgi:hypothetical protein
MNSTIVAVSRQFHNEYKRGDYIDIALTDNRTEKQRILKVQPTCLTTRKVSKSKWFEALSTWIENHILWPLSDLWERIWHSGQCKHRGDKWRCVLKEGHTGGHDGGEGVRN